MTIDGIFCECAGPLGFALTFYVVLSLVLFFILFFQNKHKI